MDFSLVYKRTIFFRQLDEKIGLYNRSSYKNKAYDYIYRQSGFDFLFQRMDSALKKSLKDTGKRFLYG